MRYYLFAGHNYYPEGGANDFVATSEDIESLKGLLRYDPAFVGLRLSDGRFCDWAHITDYTMTTLWIRHISEEEWKPVP